MKAFAYSPYGDRGTGVTPFNLLFNPAPAHLNPVALGTLKGADALVLWGGTDVHPTFYKQQPHSKNDIKPHDPIGHRDWTEWHLMREAHSLGIPIIGVCRGAQFLCVFAGGSLIQDAKGHYSGHEVITYDGETHHAAANHHQIMDPTGTEYMVLAHSKSFGQDHQIEYGKLPEGELYKKQIDPEVLWFPKVKGFAIQPHPEWMPPNSGFNQWLIRTIKHYCFPSE